MLSIALETSSDTGSVARLRDGRVEEELTFESVRRHSAEIFPALRRLGVRCAEVDHWAVGLGPGSFSGVRMALAALLGMNFDARRPVYGINSHDSIAFSLEPERLPCASVCVVSDARRGEIYATSYSVLDGGLVKVTDTRIIRPQDLPARLLSETFLVGPDLEQVRSMVEPHLGRRGLFAPASCPPPAGVAGRLAFEQRRAGTRPQDRLEPVYLRPLEFRKALA